jgi:hypothetical protein
VALNTLTSTHKELLVYHVEIWYGQYRIKAFFAALGPLPAEGMQRLSEINLQ